MLLIDVVVVPISCWRASMRAVTVLTSEEVILCTRLRRARSSLSSCRSSSERPIASSSWSMTLSAAFTF